MNLRDCFEEGLLKNDKPSMEKALKSLENSERYIQKAKSNIEIKNYDIAIFCSYTSMFHSSRALLFKDGINERSHICIVIYLKEKYPKLREFANTLDFYRRSRHSIIYGLDILTTEVDAEGSVKSAQDLLDEVRKIMH